MAGDPGEFSSEALDDVAYLGRSANRLRLLATLTSEPATRSAIEERTGIPSTTIGRILNELQDRDWVERTVDGEYAGTPMGETVVREFAPLVDAMKTVRTLGDAAAWLPMDELPIGIHHFEDATVVRPTPNSPFELVDHVAELVRNARTFRTLTFLDPPSPVGEAMHAGVVDGRLTAEHVLAGGLVAHLRAEQKSPPGWREYLEAGARVYRYDGRIPSNLFVVDETVLVMSDRPEGSGAAIQTKDETVLAGVGELFEEYRDAAEPVEPEFFA